MENAEIRARKQTRKRQVKKRRAANKEFTLEQLQQRQLERGVKKMKRAIQSADHREPADHIEPSSENVNNGHHDSGSDSDNDDGAYDICDTGSPLSINEEAIMEYALPIPASITTRNRKDYWNTISTDVKNWYSKSFELNGHPNPCLVAPNTSILGTDACNNCADAKDFTVYCYMLHCKYYLCITAL